MRISLTLNLKNLPHNYNCNNIFFVRSWPMRGRAPCKENGRSGTAFPINIVSAARSTGWIQCQLPDHGRREGLGGSEFDGMAPDRQKHQLRLAGLMELMSRLSSLGRLAITSFYRNLPPTAE